MKSRADSLRTQIDEAHGDQRAVWQVSQRLLHSKPPVYQSDEECAELATTFSQFFVEKLQCSQHAIA